MRVLMTLQYLGTRYAGWQTQANAVGVQQVVEAALSKLFQADIRIEGAGRTDSGVHALAQRAHADVPFEIARRGFLLGLNQSLPPDIRVTEVTPIADDFHCRFRSKSKTYEYRIRNSSADSVFTFATHVHIATPLDERAMHEAAQTLVGHRDFQAFTVAAPEVSSTWRTIEEISVVRCGEVVVITVTADGFLRYMVRRIAGSLIEIGRGKLAPAELLTEARWTAPAKGLLLVSIEY